MSPSPQSEQLSTYLFFTILAVTILVYLLRGLAILSFLPGGVIWILILLSIGTGIFYIVEKSRRF
ncbi:hypothetical protein PN462_06855 [Spirulina sp. CS-785/01]|uniref:hypothetical protein n=1 Tax=Spirulina sp. CS-785/01 TaxID=3021716 RepID=UPI00232BF458|nr:hypothetical protein [Spirulina sp. CS-785/01]MDB9312815.1 hypothetical protein [Spirulina sp. CS-785/01]